MSTPDTHPLVEYTGTLISAAEARTRPADAQGHAVPMLCMDVELDNTMHTRLHVEQPFPADHHQQAHAAAHSLKKGMRVTVQVPLADMRLIAANAAHIHVITPQEQAHG